MDKKITVHWIDKNRGLVEVITNLGAGLCLLNVRAFDLRESPFRATEDWIRKRK